MPSSSRISQPQGDQNHNLWRAGWRFYWRQSSPATNFTHEKAEVHVVPVRRPKPSALEDTTDPCLPHPIPRAFPTALASIVCLKRTSTKNYQNLWRKTPELPNHFSLCAVNGDCLQWLQWLCGTSRYGRLPNSKLGKKRVDSSTKVHMTLNPQRSEMLRTVLWKSTWAISPLIFPQASYKIVVPPKVSTERDV